MTAAADFLTDPTRREVWLAELYPRDPATGDEVPLYYATDVWGTLPSETPASRQYDPRLVQPLNVALDSISPGTVAILPATRGGELRLGSVCGDLDELLELDWDGARAVVRVAGFYRGGRLAYADAPVAFEGEADSALVGLEEVVVRLRDREERWEDPLESRRYFGSSWMLHFGAGSVVTLGAPAKLNITGDLTVQARVRLESTAGINRLASWANSSATYPWLLYVTNTPRKLTYRNSDAGGVSMAAEMTPGRWYTVAVTVTGTALRMYLWDEETQGGGAVVAEAFTLSTATRTASTGNLRLGESGGKSSAGWQLDELRVWGAVKTEAELDELRRRRPTADDLADASLLAAWEFEEGTGSTVADSASSPANGTASSCTWYPSLEGGASLEGKTRPIGWGQCQNVTPALVHPATLIYEINAASSQGVDAVREGGSSLGTGTSYTDLLTFLAATTTAGSWDSCITATGAWIRLGSAPSKPVTVDIRGERIGLSYVASAADIARRIVTTRGRSPITDPDDLDTASFAALNTANSATLGYYAAAGAERTVRDALEAVLGSVGAVAYHARGTGLLTVQRLEEPVSGSAVVTLDERDVVRLDPLPVELPVWEVVVRYGRNWTPLSTEQMAGALIGTAAETWYREAWRAVRVTSSAVRERHPRARTLEVETLFHIRADAEAEAARLLAMFGAERRALRVVSRAGPVLDRFAVVSVAIRDVDASGRVQERLGLGAGTSFYVLGLAVAAAEGTETLTLWR
ncbi:MAG: hypothetical protein BWX64_00285 [Acidobacteria bacterium ADurb.Bin051]|nr:MAG: hypothetical protein BWX64_00285 [Acidobacteria bacterium ADurb.Bin051]